MATRLLFTRSGFVNQGDVPAMRLDIATGEPIAVAPQTVSEFSTLERQVLSEQGRAGNWLTGIGDVARAALQGWGPGLAVVPVVGAALTAISRLGPPAQEPEPFPFRSTAMNGFTDTGSFDWGSVLQGGLNAVLQYRQQRAQAAAVSGPMALPGGVQTVGLPALGGLMARALPAIGGIVRAGVGLVRSAAGRITGVVLASGRRISPRAAVELAATVGIAAAASTLGVSEQEVAEMILQQQRRRGRRRGISAANMRTTRRTIGRIESLHRQIVNACVSARVPRRRARARARA